MLTRPSPPLQAGVHNSNIDPVIAAQISKFHQKIKIKQMSMIINV